MSKRHLRRRSNRKRITRKTLRKRNSRRGGDGHDDARERWRKNVMPGLMSTKREELREAGIQQRKVLGLAEDASDAELQKKVAEQEGHSMDNMNKDDMVKEYRRVFNLDPPAMEPWELPYAKVAAAHGMEVEDYMKQIRKAGDASNNAVTLAPFTQELNAEQKKLDSWKYRFNNRKRGGSRKRKALRTRKRKALRTRKRRSQ
jgi:hypothetical protein